MSSSFVPDPVASAGTPDALRSSEGAPAANAGAPERDGGADASTRAFASDTSTEDLASEALGTEDSEAEPAPAALEEPGLGEPEAVDHEKRVDLDLAELEAKAEKADEYLELAQRTKADFENYRKRAAREAAMAQQRGVAKLVSELLPAVDSLQRALEAAEAGGAGDDLVSGIKLVQAELLAALNRVGVELFSPEGEPFDPEQHEAVAQQPFDGAQPGTVAEVYQRGCRLGDTVIRPARVVVAG
jgi:molecular chaperone GrpE